MDLAQKELAKALTPPSVSNGTNGHAAADVENLSETSPEVGPRIHTIVLDCSSINYVDAVGQKMLKMFPMKLKAKGLGFGLAGCNTEVLDVLVRGGIIDVIGADNIFLTVIDAVSCLSQKPPAPPTTESVA